MSDNNNPPSSSLPGAATLDQQVLLMLGRIDGKLDGVNDHLKRQDTKLDEMDGRLRVVEQKAAVTGALSGGAMGVGVALILEGIRQWMSRGGNH